MIDDVLSTVPLLQLRIAVLDNSISLPESLLGLCVAFAPLLALTGKRALHHSSLAFSHFPRLIDFLGVAC